MIVLVVGGAGFIGSNVNKILHEAGYYTIVFDNLSRGSREAVICGEFFFGDMANPADLKRVFSTYSIDAVMHFAAFTDVGESVINPSVYYRNNVVNTLNLLDAMVEFGVKQFIFSSSAAIFGLPQHKYIKESHPCAPINPYGETKLIVEKILRDYAHAYGLKSCCLRYFNAAGGDPDNKVRNFRKKENNLIPIALRSLLDPNGFLTIFGTDYPTTDGTCIRDYIHVYDLAQAHISAMEQLFESPPGQCYHYNLGNGNGFSVLEVINAVEKVTGRHLSVIKGGRREGDPPILLADSQKAFLELSWVPKYPQLEPMIEHAWNAMISSQ